MTWPEEEGKCSSFFGWCSTWCCVGITDQLQLAVLRSLWLHWGQWVCLRVGNSCGPGLLQMALVGQKGNLGLVKRRSLIDVGLNQMDPPIWCFLVSDPNLLTGSWGVIHAQNVLPYHSCYQSNLSGAEACAAFSLYQLHAFFRLFSHPFCRVWS